MLTMIFYTRACDIKCVRALEIVGTLYFLFFYICCTWAPAHSKRLGWYLCDVFFLCMLCCCCWFCCFWRMRNTFFFLFFFHPKGIFAFILFFSLFWIFLFSLFYFNKFLKKISISLLTMMTTTWNKFAVNFLSNSGKFSGLFVGFLKHTRNTQLCYSNYSKIH